MPSGPSALSQQLRNSVDQPRDTSVDAMNLDEFIVPSSVASPDAIVTPAPIESMDSRRIAQRSGAPIPKPSKHQKNPVMDTPAASMPRNMASRSRNGEFDYVQRRLRKTSIDERMVRHIFKRAPKILVLTYNLRAAKDEQNFRHRCHRQLMQTTTALFAFLSIRSITCPVRMWQPTDTLKIRCR